MRGALFSLKAASTGHPRRRLRAKVLVEQAFARRLTGWVCDGDDAECDNSVGSVDREVGRKSSMHHCRPEKDARSETKA
jgi:hypothetical protein